jgi:hypothetical protein
VSPAAPKPQTDTTLAALAVLERFSTEDFESVDALMATTDARELVIGLLDVSRMLASMLAKATDGQPDEVFVHVRQTVLGLIQDGHLGTDLTPIGKQ